MSYVDNVMSAPSGLPRAYQRAVERSRRLRVALDETKARLREAEERAEAVTNELKHLTSSRGRTVFPVWPEGPVSAEEFRAAVYAENEEGGKARGAVADVADVLGVDIHAGPGSCWDLEHMRRVVDAVKELKEQADADRLRETIVRQALRITELEKGESK